MKLAPTNVLLDIGVLVSLLPLWRAQALGVEVKKRPGITMNGSDGKPLQIEGVGSIYACDVNVRF